MSIVVTILAALLAFVAVGAFTYGLAGLIKPGEAPIEQLHLYDQAAVALKEEESDDPGRLAGAVGSLMRGRDIESRIAVQLERAGLPLRASEYLIIDFLVILVAGAFAWALGMSFLMSLAFVAVGAVAPFALLSVLEKRRQAAFAEQLPDVLELIAGSLRAGCGLLQAVDLIVQEILPPASVEFQRVYTEARLGMTVEESLRGMAERLDSDSMRRVVSAIDIQKEAGGNLAELLDLVAETIRERERLKNQVKAITGESRLSAIILVVMPFVVVGLMLVTSPSYIMPLFTTPVGWMMIGTAAVLLTVGTIWLTRLVKVEV